ncbi:unnamed protein product [Lepeophtheirus salmonis]|uniref:(salmon louse) hypothetical protein n=1 Tax=Lepeophtheirus salmonis TaxID=72036 RepID=A0A7R8CFC8_LEPSM|nr:unnamed protein product [Lepeophtheirus salmonis]CAF2805390.1 unnamed protein product [Lepeophtheirus salmonis]
MSFSYGHLNSVVVYGQGDRMCRDEMESCETNAYKCMNPEYYFKCKKSCGCEYKSIKCIQNPNKCLDRDQRFECQRVCGNCDGCEDLLEHLMCNELKNLCHNENVRYFCPATCRLCEKGCRDNLPYNMMCNNFKKSGYCDRKSIYNRFMQSACQKTCNFCK